MENISLIAILGIDFAISLVFITELNIPKMRLKGLCCILLCIFWGVAISPIPSFSQSQVKIQADPVAEKILKNTSNKVNNLQDLSASFKKTLYKSIHAKEGIHYKGKLKLKKNKFYIDLDEQIIICDGKTLWNYLKKEKEVTISNYDPEEGFSPEKIFFISQKNMKYKYDKEENINNTPSDKIIMLPISGHLDYFKIEIWIDKNKLLPNQLKIYNRNGTIVSYLITDLQVNSNLQDTIFQFNPEQYPGVEIIDNRN
ncbi:MAG: outer membrane lipoprotein carrier protein LolA [Bacteroidia bacterium]|nr:outer membrane lipoprotein carrier protein LolA [Bacteroidia bacterium]